MVKVYGMMETSVCKQIRHRSGTLSKLNISSKTSTDCVVLIILFRLFRSSDKTKNNLTFYVKLFIVYIK